MIQRFSAIIIVLLITAITSYAQDVVPYPALKQQIDSLIAMDKKAGQKMMAAKSGTIDSGKAQIYGTQIGYTTDGTPFPKKLIDPEKVNERRKEVGLEPIEEYLDFIKNPRKQ